MSWKRREWWSLDHPLICLRFLRGVFVILFSIKRLLIWNPSRHITGIFNGAVQLQERNYWMALTGLSQTLHQEYLQWTNTMSMDLFWRTSRLWHQTWCLSLETDIRIALQTPHLLWMWYLWTLCWRSLLQDKYVMVANIHEDAKYMKDYLSFCLAQTPLIKSSLKLL